MPPKEKLYSTRECSNGQQHIVTNDIVTVKKEAEQRIDEKNRRTQVQVLLSRNALGEPQTSAEPRVGQGYMFLSRHTNRGNVGHRFTPVRTMPWRVTCRPGQKATEKVVCGIGGRREMIQRQINVITWRDSDSALKI